MQEFETKRNALFACLDDASSELKGTTLDQTASLKPFRLSSTGDEEEVYRQAGCRKNIAAHERGLKHLRGKESIFKKPELPIVRCLKPKRLPDYQVNPHRWKKYSLEDVDISDQTNTSAAFEFLRQIDAQKEENEDVEHHFGLSKQKIEFKKSSKIRRNMRLLEAQEQQDAEIDSPKLKGSKLIMPEYVVGLSTSKDPKKKRIHKKQERAVGKLVLSHLQEEDGPGDD